MTHEQRLFKVMSAVRDCVQACGRSPSPNETLGRYVDRLRKDPCWNDSEVEEVKNTTEMIISAGRRRDSKYVRGSRSTSTPQARTDQHW